MPELSVVVPTFRRHAVLARTLTALARQSAAPERFEVLVIDDPVEDDPAAVAAAAAALGRPLRQLHRPARGVSAARNTGWRAAAAPLVLFLGDDILADPDLVAEHLAFHLARPAATVAALGHVRWADELRRTALMTWLDDGIQSEYRRLDAGERPTWGDFLTTNVSVKRSLVERAGGFDEVNFPFLYEDTDLGMRLHGVGMELHYLPSARGQHLHRPTLAQWRSRMAATARAEQRWIALHPELDPYFEGRLRPSLSTRRAYGRLARALHPLATREVPRVSLRVRRELDLYYRQQLAPAFVAAWDEAAPG